MRISDWSSDVCSSDLSRRGPEILGAIAGRLHGVPIIYSRRNDHHESPAITRFKYKLYDRIVAISACIGEVLQDSRSEEHTSELQSLMRNSYAVFGLKKKHIQHDNIARIKTKKQTTK